jgi:HAD superfamily hydrolase (TIGR01509 family)
VIEAYVFDFDGLILDTETGAYQSIAEEYALYELEFGLAAWQAGIGAGHSSGWLDELVERCGEPIDRELVLKRRRARKLELLEGCGVLPGVAELVTEARAHGLGLAVASSSPRDWVEPHLDRLGLLPSFDAILTREDVARTKPAPDLYVAAAERLGVAAARSVAFEDSHNGSVAAKAASMWCVVAPNELTASQDFSHADVVVGSLAEVDLAALRRLLP